MVGIYERALKVEQKRELGLDASKKSPDCAPGAVARVKEAPPPQAVPKKSETDFLGEKSVDVGDNGTLDTRDEGDEEGEPESPPFSVAKSTRRSGPAPRPAVLVNIDEEAERTIPCSVPGSDGMFKGFGGMKRHIEQMHLQLAEILRFIENTLIGASYTKKIERSRHSSALQLRSGFPKRWDRRKRLGNFLHRIIGRQDLRKVKRGRRGDRRESSSFWRWGATGRTFVWPIG